VSSNSSPRVFVVDDEHVIASTLAAILRVHGYSATSFTNPLEVLAAARLRAPDLLISDVVMRGLSGVDLAIQIQVQCPECKILLFSGQATTEDLLKGARSQGHAFLLLPKPVHPSVMLLSIGALETESTAAGPKKSPSPVPELPVKASPPMVLYPSQPRSALGGVGTTEFHGR
jgi:CheY-like chemotaxis protein